MIQFEPGPEFKVNTSGIQNKLNQFLTTAIDAAADDLVTWMQQYCADATQLGPGDPAWRDEIDRYIQKLDISVGKNRIEAKVGVKSPHEYEKVRILLAAYGSGDKSTAPGWTGSPIQFGPQGRSVWNDDLTRRHPSSGRHNRPAPETWNHIGNEFPERALDSTEQDFDKIASKAAQNTSANVLEGTIYQ